MPTFVTVFFLRVNLDLCVFETLDNQKIINIG